MQFLPLISLSVLLLLEVAQGRAQATESLADKLFLRFLPPNEAAQALTPPSILLAETPIVIRYTLIGGIAIYEARAACHPTALSFFGVKDRVPKAFCTPNENAILASYTTYVALVREFPQQMKVYRAFLQKQGLEPLSKSENRSTLNGWANIIGKRLTDFFARDGWNSLGNIKREFNRVPFEDYTGYRPANNPNVRPVKLRRPLRWQPVAVNIDNLGRRGHQIHIVPQIGVRVKPLVLSEFEMNKRRPPPPYRLPDSKRRVRGSDKMTVRNGLREVLRLSATLTPMQRFLARWWDNKLLSTAGISAFYELDNRLTPFETAQQFMGEMLAQHDALLIAWREKRQNDLARPRTLLQHFRPGGRVRGFVNEKLGVRSLRVEDWRPLLGEQPHSEFPSGSASLCFAAMEHLQEYHRSVKGRLNSIKIRYFAETLPFPMPRDVTVAFDTPIDAARVCAESRLWAGVHFRPSIIAGELIGRGVGKLALQHILELGRGNIPSSCERCRRYRMGGRVSMHEEVGYGGNITMDGIVSTFDDEELELE